MSSGPHFLTCTPSSGVLGLGIDVECLESLQRNQGPGWLSQYSNRLRGGRLVVRFPAGERCFSLLYSIQTGSGAHPDFYTKATMGFFHRGKATKA
jgi:hypothetical protein